MADAAVESVHNRLMQLYKLRDQPLIKAIKTPLESLESLFRNFLLVYRGQSNNNNNNGAAAYPDLVKRINSIAYEVEDAIDAYMTQSIAYKKSRIRKKALDDAADQVKAIEEKVKRLSGALSPSDKRLSQGSTAAAAESEKTEQMEVSESVPADHKGKPKKLPYYLRSCFLYLGIFPENFEIPVWTLIRLWIAEGLIQEKKGMTLEQTAHKYINELVNRDLVSVGTERADGQIKTCRIPSQVREFLRNESGAEEGISFNIFTMSEEGDIRPPFAMLEGCRRVCIHSKDVPDKFMSTQGGTTATSKSTGSSPPVRSFLCFSPKEEPLPLQSASSIPTIFQLLKVLHAISMKFTTFPEDLIHLRYVVLSSNFKDIPKAIAELWNLQTLVVHTSSCTLEIKANIWGMLQLRHVQTNVPANVPANLLSKLPPTRVEDGENLQTLGTILPQSCTEDVFNRARNLETLAIRGPLASLPQDKGFSKLEKLKKLKLVHMHDPKKKLPELLHSQNFPGQLRWLTLRATRLEWDYMSTLANLNSLEVLKLKEKAFMGKHWKTSGGGFRGLEVLYIEDTDLETWEATAGNFPKFKRLLLSKCENLTAVPSCLKEVESFQRLELKGVKKSVKDSAEEIQKAKRKREKESDASKSNRGKLFQLHIE